MWAVMSLWLRILLPVKNNASKIVAAVLAQHADVTLTDVNMNPAHSGFLRYAILMGARIHILDQRWVGDEPVSNLRIQHAKQLQAIEVREEHISTLETELPLLHFMAQYAKGTSVFPDPSEPSGKRIIVGDPSLLPKIRPHLKELLHV
jgi:3-phosphoshikimate 1-carboxyvinyltransferase